MEVLVQPRLGPPKNQKPVTARARKRAATRNFTLMARIIIKINAQSKARMMIFQVSQIGGQMPDYWTVREWLWFALIGFFRALGNEGDGNAIASSMPSVNTADLFGPAETHALNGHSAVTEPEFEMKQRHGICEVLGTD